jgi:hypothetical protein
MDIGKLRPMPVISSVGSGKISLYANQQYKRSKAA